MIRSVIGLSGAHSALVDARDEHDRDDRQHDRQFAEFITKLNVALRPIIEVLRSTAAGEPEVATMLATLEKNRMGNMQLYAKWFAARGPLRMSTRKAAETIFTIVSPDVGRLLCDELGWSQKQHAAWVADVLKRTLLAD